MNIDVLKQISGMILSAGSRPYNIEPQFSTTIDYPNGNGTYTSSIGSASGDSGPFSVYYQTWSGVGVTMRGYYPYQDRHDYITGGYDSDVIWGGAGSDSIHGRGGNDILVGGSGYDDLHGDEGNDLILGGIDINISNATNFLTKWQDALRGYATMSDAELRSHFTIYNQSVMMSGDEGDDILIAGAGDDAMSGHVGNDWFYGGEGNDKIWGDNALDTKGGNDTLYGAEGNDSLFGGMGDDYLDGGIGNDTLIGDASSSADGPLIGNDTLLGGAGDDKLYGGAANDILDGGEGVDYLEGGDGNDTLVYDSNDGLIDGGDGTDLLLFTGAQGVNINLTDILNNPNKIKNIEIFQGTNYGDTITGDSANNVLHGGNGDDVLSGGAGNDTLFGDAGNNTLDGGDGNDLLVGGAGADQFVGGAGIDIVTYELSTVGVQASLTAGVVGGMGASGDTFSGVENLIGSMSNDTLLGNADDNQMLGLDGNDSMVGGDGNDYLDGGAANDTLQGGLGDDTLLGGAGDDLLVGNGGYDFIDGGAGNDTYLFGTGSGYDHIFEADNGGTDNLYVVGLTEVGIYKQGNHLLIAANNNDVMVLDSWYVNHGVEYIDFEAAQTRYLVSDLANMAVEIQSFGLAEGADMSQAGGVEPITVQGISALDIPVLA